LELIEWKVDLAANLDAATRRVGKTKRHVAYGANVGGDVLAYGSVAARRTDDEYAILVRKTHRCAVDLELCRIARSCDVVARDADEAVLPRAQLVIVERVGERKHWNRVRVLDERALHFRTHATRRRIGAAQLRVRGFDLLELAKQPVVFGIAELGLVEHVVLVRRPVEDLTQRLGAGGWRILALASLPGLSFRFSRYAH